MCPHISCGRPTGSVSLDVSNSNFLGVESRLYADFVLSALLRRLFSCELDELEELDVCCTVGGAVLLGEADLEVVRRK